MAFRNTDVTMDIYDFFWSNCQVFRVIELNFNKMRLKGFKPEHWTTLSKADTTKGSQCHGVVGVRFRNLFTVKYFYPLGN